MVGFIQLLYRWSNYLQSILKANTNADAILRSWIVSTDKFNDPFNFYISYINYST